MSKRMKNTYIWTALAIFPALVLCAPGIVPSFFERIGVIVLSVPWLVAALMEQEKKSWNRFYIVLGCGVLLAAITFFIRLNLNGENAIAGIIVTLIVSNLQRLYAFVLAICAVIILIRTRKKELEAREEMQIQIEWGKDHFGKKEQIELQSVETIQELLTKDKEGHQIVNEQETENTEMSDSEEGKVLARKGRTLDL